MSISIEKRYMIKVIPKKDYSQIIPIIELSIGVLVPIHWMNKEKGMKVRALPIIKIDIHDKSNPIFTLDVSTKIYSEIIQCSLDQILNYCLNVLDISEGYNISQNIDDIKITEYDVIVCDECEYVVGDIIRVMNKYIIPLTGRVCEIDYERRTFTIDSSENAKSSLLVYPIDEVFVI